ncbi:MAG: hypothetical protein ACREBR_02535 [bacterium]
MCLDQSSKSSTDTATDTRNTDPHEGTCHIACFKEQQSLKDCLNNITAVRTQQQQQQRVTTLSMQSSLSKALPSDDIADANDAVICLGPAVAAWTKCCGEANEQNIILKKKE